MTLSVRLQSWGPNFQDQSLPIKEIAVLWYIQLSIIAPKKINLFVQLVGTCLYHIWAVLSFFWELLGPGVFKTHPTFIFIFFSIFKETWTRFQNFEKNNLNQFSHISYQMVFQMQFLHTNYQKNIISNIIF